MKKYILSAIILSAIVIVAGCKKADEASSWTGTYKATPGTNDSVNQVSISEANSTTINIELQLTSGASTLTYVTLQNVAHASATTANVSQTGYILGFPALYQITGTATLSGNTLTLYGEAVNTTNSLDIKYYYFTGTK